MKGKLCDIFISIKSSKLRQNSLVSEEFIVLMKYIFPVGIYWANTTSPYIDRLKTNRKIYLNYFNIYKLILAAFVLAIKFNYDEYFTLDIYSEIGGVSQKELVALEYDFTTLLNFKFFVEEKIFQKYYNFLKSIDSDDEDCDYESDG